MSPIKRWIALWIGLTLAVTPVSSTPEGACTPIRIHTDAIEIGALLTFLAEQAGVDVIFAPQITQQITQPIRLHLHHACLQEILDVILHQHAWSCQTRGSLWWIAPAATPVVPAGPPLETRSIRLRYARASELFAVLNHSTAPAESSQGQIWVDDRSNTLVLRGTSAQISALQDLITVLDVPLKEVLVEARIVALYDTAGRVLGLDWAKLQAGVPTLKTFQSLDLALEALERKGLGRILSRPQLRVADQQPAFIESGVEIPYQENIYKGVTATAFKKAVLRLEVRPQVLDAKRIRLTLTVNQDTKGELINQVPAVNTQRLQTEVVIGTGQTIVLGGIQALEHDGEIVQVPILGDLPGIGTLFQHHRSHARHSELWVFVTPKLVP